MFEREVPYHIDEHGQKKFFLDPTKPISIDFCNECWTFLPENSCICDVCGATSGIFESYGKQECCLCGKSIEINHARELPGGILSPLPIYECNDCRNKIESITKSFKNTVNVERCKRHRDIQTLFACTECGERTCCRSPH